jgi:hypothetical protein
LKSLKSIGEKLALYVLARVEDIGFGTLPIKSLNIPSVKLGDALQNISLILIKV